MQKEAEQQAATQAEQTESNEDRERERLQLWEIPKIFVQHTFVDLFRAMLTDGVLAIGLLRMTDDTGHDDLRQFVIMAPSPSMIIGPDDSVYVLLPSPRVLTPVDRVQKSRRNTNRRRCSTQLFAVSLGANELREMTRSSDAKEGDSLKDAARRTASKRNTVGRTSFMDGRFSTKQNSSSPRSAAAWSSPRSPIAPSPAPSSPQGMSKRLSKEGMQQQDPSCSVRDARTSNAKLNPASGSADPFAMVV